MAIKPHLPLDERLSVLRLADRFRNWNSLDDQRVCILCAKTFTGRQVEIKRGRSGSFHLHCPTETCASSPMHWVYPGDPLISEAAYRDWQRALEYSDSTPAAA